MGTLSARQVLRSTATERHQYRQEMEPPGSSRKMRVWEGWGHVGVGYGRRVDLCRVETQRNCVFPNGLGGTRCEDHLGNCQVWVSGTAFSLGFLSQMRRIAGATSHVRWKALKEKPV